jgi:RNA polymerase sigma-70 factor (ECF subfamily)
MSDRTRADAYGTTLVPAAKTAGRELVLRAQQGDREAYSQLTSGVTSTLFRVAGLILRNEDRAADAVQDALLRGWIDLRGLRDPDRFDGWLYRVLVRTCYASARRHRQRTVAEIKLALPQDSTTPDTAQAYAVRDQLERGFNRLSVEHRTVIVLVHYLGLSLKEAAAAIGVPVGTVQSRLNRAIDSMRSALAADDRQRPTSHGGFR